LRWYLLLPIRATFWLFLVTSWMTASGSGPDSCSVSFVCSLRIFECVEKKSFDGFEKFLLILNWGDLLDKVFDPQRLLIAWMGRLRETKFLTQIEAALFIVCETKYSKTLSYYLIKQLRQGINNYKCLGLEHTQTLHAKCACLAVEVSELQWRLCWHARGTTVNFI